jgi:formate hydrogenlyase transcriptional activator
MVEAGTFRGELLYRLNVFPIMVPPLRERPEDITLLIRYFVDRFSRRMGRVIESIPEETLASLLDYSWPGNIRELQNFVERAVIVSTNGILRNPFELGGSLDGPESRKPLTLQRSLDEAERALILGALARTNWIVGGPGGAASVLGLKRTGLLYKMRRLGIARVGRGKEVTDGAAEVIARKNYSGEGASSVRLG